MQDFETKVGVRERKARQTREAIHQAAWGLASEFGVAKVSVEAIAAGANVSTRTVFNYFATKEDAVLGTGEIVMPSEAVDEFLAGTGPLVDDLADLLLAIARESRGDMAQVLALIDDNPSLFEHLHKDIRRLEAALSAVVERRTGDRLQAEVAVATVGRLAALMTERWLREGGEADQRLMLRRALDALRQIV